MKTLYSRLGALAIVGLCLLPQRSLAYVIPINSSHENMTSNIALLIESEITRWKQEALKYRELLYTDILGQEGSLGKNPVINSMQDAAKDGEAVLQKTATTMKYVSDLSDYGTAKSSLEQYYVVDPEKGLEYTTQQMNEILENQRVAINDLAKNGIALAAVDTVWTSINSGESQPGTRASAIAKAKDMNALYEMMLAMDRSIYERSLRISGVEATDAGIHAMQTLQGLARTASKQYSEEKGDI